MMLRLLPCFLLALPASAGEPILQEITKSLTANITAFDSVNLPADGSPTRFSVTLGTTTAPHEDGQFDGFRFRCPEDIKGKDFIWYFNAPESWGHWYIIPATGEADSAFKDWLEAVRLYADFDKASELPRLRVLQSLKGSYFKPGGEYILWFRKASDAKDSPELRGTLAFAPEEKSWERRDIEEALKLKSAPAAEQVTALGSRGGTILLDERFFTRDYAEGRIESALDDISNAQRLKGGFFITTQTAIPNCATSPSIRQIQREHGEPDFIRDMEEMDRVHKQGGEAGSDDEEKGHTRYYYDHFAFEVKSGEENPKVLRVITSATDFSESRPAIKGSTFASVEFENLTVFRRDGMEVGRAYYFMEGSKQPVFITVPPEGNYQSTENETLTNQSGGNWIWESRYGNGNPQWRRNLREHQLDGPAEGFHPDGKTSIKGFYQKGKPHGEWIRYDESGKETGRRKYDMGEVVDP